MADSSESSDKKKRSALHPRRLLPRLAFYYVAYALLAFFFQDRLIFPGQSLDSPRPYDETFPGGRLFSLTTEGATVPAVYVAASNKGNQQTTPVLIVAHGNFEIIDHWQPLVENFTEAGLAVLLVEYPGYGRGTGKPVQKNLTALFSQAYDWLLREENGENRPLIGLGRSIGTGVVCDLSRERDLDALILMSPMKNLTSMAHRRGLPGFLVRSPFDNVEAVTGFAGPVLVVHGRKDGIIPFHHGEAVSQAAPKGELMAIEGVGHNDLLNDWHTIYERVVALTRQLE